MKRRRNATQAELNYALRRVVYDTLVAAKSAESLSTTGKDYSGKEMAKMSALIMARNLHMFFFIHRYDKDDDINVTDFSLFGWKPSSTARLSKNVYERINKTYDGPLSLAEDFMVWNVTGDDIRVRMAVVEERTWSPPLASPAIPPDMADRAETSERLGWELGYTDFIANGKLDVDDVLRPIYEEASQVLGREFPYPGDEQGD